MLANRSGLVVEIIEQDLTDIDGSRPNMNRYLAQHHPELLMSQPGVAEWTVALPAAVPVSSRNVP